MAARGRDVPTSDNDATRLSTFDDPTVRTRGNLPPRVSVAAAKSPPASSTGTHARSASTLAQPSRSTSEPFISPPVTSASASRSATFTALNARPGLPEHRALQNPRGTDAAAHDASDLLARLQYDMADVQRDLNPMIHQLTSSWALRHQDLSRHQAEGSSMMTIARHGSLPVSAGAPSTTLASLTSAHSSALSRAIAGEEWNALGSFQAPRLQGSLSSLTDDVADVEAALPRPQRAGSFQERHHDGAAGAATGLIPDPCGPLDRSMRMHSMRQLGSEANSSSLAAAEARQAAFVSDTSKSYHVPAGTLSLGADSVLLRDLEAFARSLNPATARGNAAASLPYGVQADPPSPLPPTLQGLPAGAAAVASQHYDGGPATPVFGSQQGLPTDRSNSRSLSALQAPATVLMAQAASGNQQIAENALLIGLLNGMLQQGDASDAGVRSNSLSSRTLQLDTTSRVEHIAMQSLLGQLRASQRHEGAPARAALDGRDGSSELAQLLRLQQAAMQAVQGQAGILTGVQAVTQAGNVPSQQVVDRARDGSPCGSQNDDEGLEARDAMRAEETAEAASEGDGLESPRDEPDASKQSKGKGKGRMEVFKLKPRSMKERARRERIR